MLEMFRVACHFARALVVCVALLSPLSRLSHAESGSESSETVASDAASRRLSSLLEAFARVPGLAAEFREEKRIALLEAPLRSEGRIYFAPPDRLARHQVVPEESSVLLVDRSLVLRSQDGVRRIDLGAQPLVAALVDSFRLLLGGRLQALREHYVVELTSAPDAEPWEVRLTPLDPVLRRAVERIEIQGRDVHVSQLRILESTGDESVVRFDAIDPERRFTAEELDALFRIEP